tara:strand:- start:506 stop:862 length:357 start_codon:yes stop_codon:yes gene_type:complete
MNYQNIKRGTCATLEKSKGVCFLDRDKVKDFKALKTGWTREQSDEAIPARAPYEGDSWARVMPGDRIVCLEADYRYEVASCGFRSVWVIIEPDSEDFGKVFMIDTSSGENHSGLRKIC